MAIYSDNPFILQASALIEERTGLARSAQFQVNLEAVLRDLAAGDLPALTRALRQSPETGPLWQRLMNALLIGETYFFRNRAHFDALRERILPDLTARRSHQAAPRLHIWSAGCATGEEAYSIAITLREALPDLARWQLQLIGSDINAYALEMAQRGIYRDWAFRHTAPHFRLTYFDAAPEGFHIHSDVRALATFRHSNLLAGPPLPQLDVIFCCNVLIYFDEAYIRRVEDMLFQALAPGGWLLLGPSEVVRFRRERWQIYPFQDAVLYQKPVHTAAPLNMQTPVPAENTNSLYQEAVQAARARQYDDAEQLLNRILINDPNQAAAHVLMGSLFANRQMPPAALRHLETALRLNPLLADAHYLKGVLYLENEKVAEGKDALRAALYCQQGHPLAALALGHCYVREHEIRRARSLWQEARDLLTALPPDSPLSDITDMTPAEMIAVLTAQIENLPHS
jgi:chemotaxis protein methyltransferase CheR